MDIRTEKLNQMEAKLNEVLAEIDKKSEEPNRVLSLINPTAEQYADAWDTLSILDIIKPHVEALRNKVKHGEYKRVGQFIDFTLYQLDRFGEKDPKQTVVYPAQQTVIDIYTKFRKKYFLA